MMLRELKKQLPLETLIRYAVERDMADASVITDFLGDGCCEAENHTVDSLLNEWQETTEKMLSLMSGRG